MDTQNRRHSKKFYENAENVRQLVEATEGLDSGHLIGILKKYLKPASTVLEIGIGAGRDLDILKQTFKTVGSDYSQTFLDLYRQKNPTAELLLLDAVTLKTENKFDGIYSNKVLHHLTTEDLSKSLLRQREILSDGGIIFHTFWNGTQRNSFQDLQFIQYTRDDLIEIIKPFFNIIEIDFYEEINLNDSIYVVLQVN